MEQETRIGLRLGWVFRCIFSGFASWNPTHRVSQPWSLVIIGCCLMPTGTVLFPPRSRCCVVSNRWVGGLLQVLLVLSADISGSTWGLIKLCMWVDYGRTLMSITGILPCSQTCTKHSSDKGTLLVSYWLSWWCDSSLVWWVTVLGPHTLQWGILLA